MQYAVGIDVGGSKIALALVTESGGVPKQVTLPTEPEQPFAETLERLRSALERLTGEAGIRLQDCLGVGVGCTGPLDVVGGLVLNPYILPGWDGVNLVRSLGEATGLPVWMENDADAALLGEWFAGAGQDVDDLVMLTLGTGVGGAALSGGELYRGANLEHPEIGHIPIDPSGPECYCGTRGCLESLASGEGIANQGEKFGFDDSRAVFEKAAEGDPAARDIVNRAVSALEMGVWTILHTFLPSRLILGGGIVEKHGSIFLKPLQQIPGKARMITQGQVAIVEAALGNLAGVIGAGSLVFRGLRPGKST